MNLNFTEFTVNYSHPRVTFVLVFTSTDQFFLRKYFWYI